MTELKDVLALFQHWLGEHDIQQEGVRMEITFPMPESAARAEAYLVRELTSMTYYITQKYWRQYQLNGVNIRFDQYEQPKWR